MKEYDIAIIGGGASGLAAAIEAKRSAPALSAAVIERLPRVGKKLLSTGNGRCNFTNRDISAERYTGSCRHFFPLIESFDTEGFLRGLGVYGAADGQGRVYPLSGSASAVLDALRLEAKKLGVEELCGLSVEKISAGKRFTLTAGDDKISAKAVILAGGGMSQSALGSDGSAIRLAKSLGLRCAPLAPALVPLITRPEAVKGLKGVRAEANASLLCGGRLIKSESGEVQFGENTLSGICIFNLSLWYDGSGDAEIALDLLAGMSGEELFAALKFLRESRAGAAPEDMLTGLLHKRLGLLLMGELAKKPVAELTDGELEQLSRRIKDARFPILGAAGFEKSQATRGGVLADELSDKLEAIKIPRLFLCGEMLDITGECGGYNLTFAFASGAAAGRSCAEALT